LVFSTPGSTYFSAPCLQSGGFAGTCEQLQTQLNAYYVCNSELNASAYHDIACSTPPCDALSCTCDYTYEVDVVDQGAWTATGGILTQKSTSYTFNGSSVIEYAPVTPINSTYCNSGGLTITGDQGASLSNILGLRTMTMHATQPPPVVDAGTPPTPSICGM
jgi:hypothetical protein